MHEMGGDVEGFFFLNLACRVVLHQLKGWAVSEEWGACWANLSCLSVSVMPHFISFPCRPAAVPFRRVSMPCQMMFWADANSLRRLRLEERGK